MTTWSSLGFLCITLVLPALFLSLCGRAGEKSEVLLVQEFVIVRNTFSGKKLFLKQVIRNRRALKPRGKAKLEALQVSKSSTAALDKAA